MGYRGSRTIREPAGTSLLAAVPVCERNYPARAPQLPSVSHGFKKLLSGGKQGAGKSRSGVSFSGNFPLLLLVLDLEIWTCA